MTSTTGVSKIKKFSRFDSLILASEIYPSTFMDPRNKKRDMLFINEKVFNFTVLGFTGKEVETYKWDYVEEFEKLKTEAVETKMLEMKEHCTVLVENAKELYENSVGEMSLRKVLKVLGLTDTLSEGEAWDKLEQKKIAKAFYPPTKRRRLLDMTKGSQSSTGKSTILFKPEAIRSILEN